jgi:hypothetical protein
MAKIIPGLNWTTLERRTGPAGPGHTGREDGSNVHFHPLCSERLSRSIREKNRRLTEAKREAIPSILNAIGQLDSDPGAIAPETVCLLADTLRSALSVLETAEAGEQFVSDQDKAALQEAEAHLQEALVRIGYRGPSPLRQ